MMPVPVSSSRRRRGVEAIEFAMILPVFIVILFSIFEFSNYMFQRSATVDAARRGCRAAAQLDPAIDDYEAMLASRVTEVLNDSHLLCGTAGVVCNVDIKPAIDDTPPRLICEATVTYRPLTGLFGQAGDGGALAGAHVGRRRWGGFGILPDNLRGQASALLEGVGQ
jgi:hypothetical protein